MALQMVKNLQKVNATEVYYELYRPDPAFPTVVLIHGFLSSSFSFRKLVPLLTKTFNVLLVDIPPFGQSGKGKGFQYSFSNMAHTIAMLLEGLGINRCGIIGHSMGGQISLQLAKEKPELIEHIVLLCSLGYSQDFPKRMKYLSYLPFFSAGVKLYLQKSGLENNLQKVVYNRTLIDDEMRSGYLAPFSSRQIFGALGKMLRDKEIDLNEDELSAIKTPCLLIWGRQDEVVPLSIGRRLQKDLPNSELIILEDTGHLLPEEKPLEIYHFIREFHQKMPLD